jgi:Glutathione-dependent formaldehyde-activating enzyme
MCARWAADRDLSRGPLYCLLTPTQALCHCADCRKISGGNYSNNIVVPSQNFKILSGTPKEISKTADSGKEITSGSPYKRFPRANADRSFSFQTTSAETAGRRCSDMGTRSVASMG